MVVLWVGAQDVLAGQITPGRLSQFILYAVLGGSALGSLSEIGGEVAQASGAAERLFEILAIQPAIARPPHPAALPSPARGEVAFEDVHFSYPTRPNVSALNGVSFAVRPGREGRDRRPVRRRQEHDLSSVAALLRSDRRPRHARRRASLPNSIRRTCARASRSCRRTA